MGSRVRACAAALLLGALLASCGADEPHEPGDRQATLKGCVGDLVRGDAGARQTHGCRGVEVHFPNPKFIPQGLTLGPGETAYISGYDYEPIPGDRECQVAQVDRATGRVLAWQGRIFGEVPGVGESLCRHAGGVALTEQGLWVAGARRLWLLDPARLTTDDPVLRVWAFERPAKASTVAADGDELVVGIFRPSGHARMLRFRYADLFAPGAVTLVGGPDQEGVQPSAARRIPSRVQGVVATPRGHAWLVRSTTYCGELVTPSGRRIPFVPGAEGFAFDGSRSLVVVSESGSGPYQRMGGRPDVPTLSRIDRDLLDRSVEADC